MYKRQLTYGSPLRRLYGRWFPAYFGPVPLRALHRQVDCWRNLWRATDPIGGPVIAGPSEDVDTGPLADPLAYGRSAHHPLPAPVLGHFDYQADPAFAAERDALLARLAGPPRPDDRDGREGGEDREARPRPGVPAPRISKEPAAPADPPETAG